MEPTPQPPSRRRRRTFIALAVLVLALAWWFWPRVDQRLIGTWTRAVPQTIELGENIYVFRSDGTGTSGTSKATENTFHWKVRDSRLKLIYGHQPGLYGLFDRTRNLLGFPSMMYDGQKYLIRDITADRALLQLVSPGKRITSETDEVFELKRRQ